MASCQQKLQANKMEVDAVLVGAKEKAPAPTTTFTAVNAQVDIDLEQLAKEVRQALIEYAAGIGTNQDLGKVTRDIVCHFLNAYPKFNVMVVHPTHIATFQEFVKEETNVPYAYVLRRHYDVYVFKRGTFTLLADGGFENWCFGGNWERDGKHVTFHDRA